MVAVLPLTLQLSTRSAQFSLLLLPLVKLQPQLSIALTQ
jgi:hypothetical protein